MKVAQLNVNNPLVGTWVDADELGSTVEYRISVGAAGLVVSAVDSNDEEAALVSEVESGEGQLSFVARWQSTGRVCRCKLKVVSKNEALFTFSYTEQGRLVRKAT